MWKEVSEPTQSTQSSKADLVTERCSFPSHHGIIIGICRIQQLKELEAKGEIGPNTIRHRELKTFGY